LHFSREIMILIYKRKGRRGAYGSRKQNRLFLELS